MNSIVAIAASPKYLRAKLRARRVALHVLRFLKKDGQAVDIFIVSDAEMRKLNRQSRGKDRPANVLSFGAPKVRPPTGGPAERVAGFMERGEIYLAPDYIARHGESFDYMVIHGLLHLLRYDHGKKRDMMRMERLEASFMKRLNG